MNVETVLGSIDPDHMGITLSHEHLIGDFRNWWTPPEEASKLDLVEAEMSLENISKIRRSSSFIKENYVLTDIELAIEELKIFKLLDGGCIIDLTLPGAGRDVLALKRISYETQVNIVAGTGWYVENSHPSIVKEKNFEDLSEIIIKELKEGIGFTNIKAGIIGEIGCSSPLHENEIKVLKAAALAQKETGTCISIHSPAKDWRDGHKYLDIIEEVGGDLEKVVMLHMDHYSRENNPLGLKTDYHRSLLERGVTIAYDAFGRYQKFNEDGSSSPTDRERIAAIIELCEEDYDKKIVISHDVYLKMHLTKYGGQGYGYILKYIIPAFKRHGITDQNIKNMLVENPKRLLSF